MSVKLNVPYLSQLDNVFSPTGTCQLTSVAMCMKFFGVKGDGNGQLEDQLFRRYGDRRWYPSTMIEAFSWKGIKDVFKEDATVADIKSHLDKGKPCIIHGYFTPIGHIIVICGYDDEGFIVNDPYGEYHRGGYDTYVSGEGLHYSYELIRDTCQDDVGMWVHFVG